ncbi:hypothetical protein [Natronomonas marina]|jgi:hypothetical protein|uniref:hypothetical protein n=1 Tax=Natronomonas marina TaxID=2961939 RepID=UPI0020C9EDF5|nr:hypothetical protein [Natronomonas marina]
MADDEPADTMRERSPRSALTMRLLLDADRWLITAGIVALVFVGVVAASFLFEDAGAALQADDPIETAFQALIGATVTGVTLVLTLNQLVLSQELGAVDDQQSRMEGAMSFRADAADILGETPPAEPSAFLRSLVAETADRARAVGDAAGDDEEIERLVDSTVGNASAVEDRLEGASFGQFAVVRAALDFNYSWKLYAANRLQDREDLDSATLEALEDLAEALRLFGPAREHFKTLYFQSELIDLSRTVLYTAIPSLVVAMAVVLFLDVQKYPGTVLGVDLGVVLVAAGAAIVLVPFAVLLAYVLRIATITGRTLSIGPFILRKTDRDTQK